MLNSIGLGPAIAGVVMALGTAVVLCLLGIGALIQASKPARAEMPPYVYADMQADAPEVLTIAVTDVATEAISDRRTVITATARVTTVERSGSGLKPGDVLIVRYQRESHPEGWTGPSEVPLLAVGDQTEAFLAPSGPRDGTPVLRPAAGGWSFGPRADAW